MIKGISIELKVKTLESIDDFGQKVYNDKWETIPNVLVGSPSAEDVTTALQMHGKKIRYQLAIPKGDMHSWEDTDVRLPEPFKGIYHTVDTIAGIENMIPLKWNKKVSIEYIKAE